MFEYASKQFLFAPNCTRLNAFDQPEKVGALGQIRTDVELSLTGFADQRLQPLGYERMEIKNGAESRDRTDGLLITKQPLCQLSYLGEKWWRVWKDSNPRRSA